MPRCTPCGKRIWRLWQGHVHGCSAPYRLSTHHSPSSCPNIQHTKCQVT